MAYNLFPLGIIPWITGTNTIGTGYLVYSYITDTSTPKNTYTDSTGATANDNPVVFDINGLKQIWLKDDVAYKLVVKTSAGVEVITLNNVIGIAPPSGASSSFTTIYDSNLNESMGIIATASAVNYLQLINSATGNAVQLQSVGDDTNVGLTLTTQGSGAITLAKDTTASSTLAVTGASTFTGTVTNNGELVSTKSVTFSGLISPTQITSNQDDYSPASLSSSFVVSLSSDTTRNITGLTGGAQGRMLWLRNGGGFPIVLKHETTSTAANRFFFSPAADITLQSAQTIFLIYSGSRWQNIAQSSTIYSFAVQSDQETGSSTTVMVNPAVQQYHPSAAKTWVYYTSVTTTAISASYNMTSLTDNGTGDTTLTIATDFSSANYCYSVGTRLNGTSNPTWGCAVVGSQTAGTLRIQTTVTGPSVSDTEVSVSMFGDQ